MNTTSIQNNATAIGVNTAGVNINAGEINTNSTNIGINASGISANVTDIQTNATDIQTNATAISNVSAPKAISIFMNGIRVGAHLGFTGSIGYSNVIFALLDSTYIAPIDENNFILQPAKIWYASNDCTGQAYITQQQPFVTPISAYQGVVFSGNNDDPHNFVYIPSGTAREAVTIQSYWLSLGVCQTMNEPRGVFKAFPNDSNIIGVTGAEFVGPLTFGF